MSEQCLSLRELRFARNDGLPAQLTFGDGLNVITGASDTGKSYILDSVNYMLGGQSPPEQIPEAQPYSELFLEIALSTGRVFTLERALRDGGDFRLYGEANPLSSKPENFQLLAARHGNKAGRSLSQHLLEYCDLANKKIMKAAGQTRDVRFRDLVPFILVNETRIIDKGTPLRGSGQYTAETEELSTFDMLISGRDSSTVIALPDRQAVKVNWEARRNLYDELIERLRGELASASLAPDSASDWDATLEAEIQETIARLDSDTAALQNAIAETRRLSRERQRVEARATSFAQLIERFALLREHYNSDKERLRFISEGDYFLSQLGEPHCPTCGQLMRDHSDSGAEHLDANTATLQSATQGEVAKLDVQLADLDATLVSLTADQSVEQLQLGALGEAIARQEGLIKSDLEPIVLAARDTIRELVARREAQARLDTRRKELLELEERRMTLGDKPPARKASARMEVSPGPKRDFCEQMAATLRAWNYPVHVVEFDSKSDLVIDGKARRSHGKGVRAILHAAFNIALLRHTREKNLPHPGFVILDSPLTSFKGKDAYEAGQDVQRAFFEDLSREHDRQVVIIENKEPPEDLKASMHYTHFSGVEGIGRAGMLER